MPPHMETSAATDNGSNRVIYKVSSDSINQHHSSLCNINIFVSDMPNAWLLNIAHIQDKGR